MHTSEYVAALLRERVGLVASGQLDRVVEVDVELARHGHQIETAAAMSAPETTARPRARKKASDE